MPAIYSLQELADPNIEIFAGRDDFEQKKGRPAPAPNFFYPQQFWSDRRPGLQGRITYPWVIDTSPEKNGLVMHPITIETDPNRLQFYREYGIREIPRIVPGAQTFASFVIQPNFPYEKPGQYNDPLWAVQPSTYFPVRQLNPNEAFFPSPFDPLAIANMDEVRKTVPPKFPSTPPEGGISNVSPQIQELLSQILAGQRLIISMLQK